MNNILIYFAIKYSGNFMEIYNALKTLEKVPEEELEKIDDLVKSKEIKAITIMDEEYPESFKILTNPPFVIFYEGNIELLKREWKMTLTGDFHNEKIDEFLNQSLPEVIKRHTLVTCYYKNLDMKINDFYKLKQGETIYISANGLNNPYFANKVDLDEKTLIISEYPNNVNISKNKLRNRNRLVAALSDALIIYSSKTKSGIMNLVSNFLNVGKEVYCFPGDFSEEDGNSSLIKQGANLITSVKDVYEFKEKEC
ncbi:DNA-processing protein DprA [Mycoplasma sp. 480]|uniref:DNA-processing protein DprA n=1 Tax=Mycoplasma sp. 480 TaxID=3440155 RepID=UPI003F5187CF